MSELPMAGHPGETPLGRYYRLQSSADVFRRIAQDALEESDRAAQRARDAVMRANDAAHEANLARSAYLRWRASQEAADDT